MSKIHAPFNDYAICNRKLGAVSLEQFFNAPKWNRCLSCEYKLKAHGYDLGALERKFKNENITNNVRL